MIKIFRVFIPAGVIGLILSEFLLIFLCYIAGCALITPTFNPDFDLRTFIGDYAGLIRIAIPALCMVAGIYFQDLYSNFRIKGFMDLAEQIFIAISGAILSQFLLSYLKQPTWTVPRPGMFFGSVFVLLLLPVWRVFYGSIVIHALGFQRVLLLGASSVVQEIAAYAAEHPEIGMRILGYVDSGEPGEALPGGSVLGPICSFAEIAKELKPDLVVVGMAERRNELPMNDMLHLRFSGIRFEEAAITFETTFGRVLTRQMRPARLIFSSEFGPGKGSLFVHYLYSMPIAAILFVLFLPLMAIVAILVKLTSRGPVLHRQVRVGLNDSTFTLYKFRSMSADAEAETGPVWAQKHDKRVTPVGKWLRRLRLDELPQLVNVLTGSMAMVGPRPERPEFVKSLTGQIPYYNYRHCVKPGITGWAQINYKYGDTLGDVTMKLEYDLYYIKNMAFSLDMYIIFHTMKVMFFSDSAQ